jgi:hypothetical protein
MADLPELAHPRSVAEEVPRFGADAQVMFLVTNGRWEIRALAIFVTIIKRRVETLKTGAEKRRQRTKRHERGKDIPSHLSTKLP